VFTTGGDPVQLGLVASLNRPGGNVTGATILSRVLVGKQLEILHEFVPSAAVVEFLVNPNDANAQSGIKDAIQGAETLRQTLAIARASFPWRSNITFPPSTPFGNTFRLVDW
jgi:putative ABC transport system substrate-binding protein